MYKNSEKISVIVPFYNSEKTLERCISSILEQTYTNFELLMIDDGSSDASCKIIRRFAKEDERITLIKKEHAGVSAARNLGIDLASGAYIQFVDADDDIAPDMFETMLALIHEHDADVAICNFTHPCLASYLGDAIFDMTKPEDMLELYQNTFAAHLPWNKLFRRKVIKSKFFEDLDFCEDGMFFISNMHNAKRIVSTPRVLYNYYVAPKETSIEESSCINKMAKAENFWESKNTYWYKLARLLPRTEKIFAQYVPTELLDEFKSVRVFDFVLWEFIILGSMGTDAHGLTLEMLGILSEPDFIDCMRAKEPYGIKFSSLVSNEQVAEFVRTCLDAQRDIALNRPELHTFDVLTYIFARFFISCDVQNLDRADFLARAAADMFDNATPEARYANSILTATITA